LIEPHDAALAEAALAASLTVGAREIARAFRRAIAALNCTPDAPASTFRDLVAAELGKLGLESAAVEEQFWAVLDKHNVQRTLWTQPMAGAAEVLAGLKAGGIKVGVVS